MPEKWSWIQSAFDLEKTVFDVIRLLTGTAVAKDIELIIDYPPEHPNQVVGDEGKIRQVLINLVGNAIKFTRSGHVLVTVRASGQEQSDSPRSIRDSGHRNRYFQATAG